VILPLRVQVLQLGEDAAVRLLGPPYEVGLDPGADGALRELLKRRLADPLVAPTKTGYETSGKDRRDLSVERPDLIEGDHGVLAEE